MSTGSHKSTSTPLSRGIAAISLLKRPLLPQGSHQSVLKCGSLLKKKVILVGWQSRFFVLYPGRIDYFADEQTYRSGTQPRASILLFKTEILKSEVCMINGTEHFALT